MENLKRILCYGDSTHGAIAGDGKRFRLMSAGREDWQKSLGEFVIIEEGQNGRTTVWDDQLKVIRMA